MSRRAQLVSSAAVSTAELGDSGELLRRNRIPPSQAASVGQLQMLALRAAEECLESASLDDEDRSRTAVLVGATGNHALQRRNALRVASGHAPAWGAHGADPDAAVDAACEVFGAGPHDKIGEMASSVPSRIAIAHRLRGRVLVLDAHETTAAVALWHARHCLEGGAESAVLVVVADEDETAAARSAWQEATGRSGESQPGRAVAVLLRPEGEDPTAAGSAIVDEVRFRRGDRGDHRYPLPSPEELDAWLTGIAPATGGFVLRGDAFLPIAAQSQNMAVARRVHSGRTAAGSVRVTDAMLDVLDAARDCPDNASALTLTGSVTGTLAAVTLNRPDPAERVATPPNPTAVAVDGAGAWFGGRQGLDAFRDLSLRGESIFGDLDDVAPAHLRSAGRIRLGRTYSVRGVRANPPVGMDPVRRAALETCREAVQRSTSELSGRGLVLVATPIGPSAGRLCDARSEETASALHRIGERVGAEPEAVAEVREWLAEFAAASGAPATSSIESQHAGSVAEFVADEIGLDAVPVAVEAACASTLAAVDVAVGALRAGEVDYALVCGVEFPASCRDLVLCSALGMLSTTTLSPFAAAADGFLPGDGAGALVLVPRDKSDAGDPTTGIVGIGGSCDAHSMLAPSAGGQEAAMARALVDADVPPSDVAFIETHGTGTLRGDAIELESMRTAYGDGPITLGAVKSLLGHTFAAAGMAGLLRAVTALEDGVVPPSAGLTVDDTRQLAERGFIVPSTPRPIRPEPTTRAAVSSFGTGGINYHIVVDRSET